MLPVLIRKAEIMKIGDKVRFLNTVGGGVVKGFQSKEIALVEDEDGFDIPVLIRECVVIEPAKDIQVRTQASVTGQLHQEENKLQTQIIHKQAEAPLFVEETKEGEQITVCLAYLPVDRRNLSNTAFECFLVNDSNYELSFNYMTKLENSWVSRETGIVAPNTKIFIDEFGKEEINDRENSCLQFIAYKKNKPFNLKNTFSAELRVDTVKFYKLHSFRENDYFEEDALLYFLVKKDLPERELKISAEELELAMIEKKDARRERIQPVKKKQGRNEGEIIEVDLHIDELLDSTTGLLPVDILNYQLEKFHEVMNENLKKRGQKIVFIHGKGNGVLKNEILKELKSKYKTVYYQDASFREYGYGATMITIK